MTTSSSSFLSAVGAFAIASVAVAGCSGSTASTTSDAGLDASADVGSDTAVDASADVSVDTTAQCNVAADCGMNIGGACPSTCDDGSDPCLFSCVNHACVQNGCPVDVDATGSDGGASEAFPFDFGSEVTTVGDAVSGGGSGPVTCVPSCGGDATCVVKQVVGGALVPVSDAGTCPVGRHPVGSLCEADPTFECNSTPTACGGLVSCGCAASLCGSYTCVSAAENQVNCVLDAP